MTLENGLHSGPALLLLTLLLPPVRRVFRVFKARQTWFRSVPSPSTDPVTSNPQSITFFESQRNKSTSSHYCPPLLLTTASRRFGHLAPTPGGELQVARPSAGTVGAPSDGLRMASWQPGPGGSPCYTPMISRVVPSNLQPYPQKVVRPPKPAPTTFETEVV